MRGVTGKPIEPLGKPINPLAFTLLYKQEIIPYDPNKPPVEYELYKGMELAVFHRPGSMDFLGIPSRMGDKLVYRLDSAFYREHRTQYGEVLS